PASSTQNPSALAQPHSARQVAKRAVRSIWRMVGSGAGGTDATSTSPRAASRREGARQARPEGAECAPRTDGPAASAAGTPAVRIAPHGVLTERKNGLECAAPFDETASRPAS